MEQLAAKSRMLAELVREIRRVKPSAVRDDYVNTFNALTIPRGYLYIDPDGLVHVVMLRKGTQGPPALPSFGSAVAHSADVIWDFDPVTGLWNTLKDRTGDFEKLCPIKCGGIPSRRNSVSQP